MKKTNQRTLDTETATQAIDFVYSNLLDVSRIQIIYPLIVAYVFWGELSPWVIALWCFGSCMVYVARMVLTLQYRKYAAIENNPWKWGRLFSATSIASGLLWGFSAWIFYAPESQTGLVLLYVLIVGTAAGAVMISSYWMPGYLFYAVPAVSLTALSLFVNGDRNENILGFMLILTLAMLVSVAFKSREQGYAGIRLRFENLALIDKLNTAKEKAEDANRAKTQFLASANHDLRQPVHALSLLSHSMQSELQTDRGKSIYSKLDLTVSNLNSLLESLLDLSQLEAGALRIEKTHISLRTLCDQLQSESVALCDEKNLEFRMRSLDAVVYTDPTLLARLLRNLLNNAVRYTDKGGILLAFRRASDVVSIEVWDTGIGIKDVDQQQVYREFYQVGNTARDKGEGLGLGLSICSKIATLLDLELEMSSVYGKGSVFRVRVPLVQHADVPVALNDSMVPRNSDELALQGVSIMVIDDDLMGLSAMSDVLSSYGMNTVLAQTQGRALTLLEEYGRVDMVLSDYRLGEEVTGLDLIKQIRQLPRMADVPALIVTGDTAPEVLQEIAATYIPCIHKPINPALLEAHLTALLQGGAERIEAVDERQLLV